MKKKKNIKQPINVERERDANRVRAEHFHKHIPNEWAVEFRRLTFNLWSVIGHWRWRNFFFFSASLSLYLSKSNTPELHVNRIQLNGSPDHRPAKINIKRKQQLHRGTDTRSANEPNVSIYLYCRIWNQYSLWTNNKHLSLSESRGAHCEAFAHAPSIFAWTELNKYVKLTSFVAVVVVVVTVCHS